MKNAERLIKIVYMDLEKAGLKPGKVDCFNTSKHLSGALGKCYGPLENGAFAIELTEDLFFDTMPEQNAKDVIAHELLHTIAVGDGHGKKFKVLADQLHEAFPKYDALSKEPVYTQNNLGDDIDKYKYVLECQKCGQLILRMKSSDMIKNYNAYHHSSCGGKFTRIK